MIIAIDPGPEKSAWMTYEKSKVGAFGIDTNGDVLHNLCGRRWPDACQSLIIEMVACYGMPVGKEVFETCMWIGRFIQAWGGVGGKHRLMYRRDVKLHLCNSAKAKDSNIRQALLDRFGGSKAQAIGTKANPGPLYGISSHLWSALAVAVTYEETQGIIQQVREAIG